MGEALLFLLIMAVAAIAAAVTILWEALPVNDLCQPKIVAVLVGLSGMLGVVLGSFLGRKIERVKIDRAKRERREDERRL